MPKEEKERVEAIEEIEDLEEWTMKLKSFFIMEAKWVK